MEFGRRAVVGIAWRFWGEKTGGAGLFVFGRLCLVGAPLVPITIRGGVGMEPRMGHTQAAEYQVQVMDYKTINETLYGSWDLLQGIVD